MPAGLRASRGALFVVAVTLLLIVVMTDLKVLRVDRMRGDTATFFEVTQGIGAGAGMRSALYASIREYQLNRMLRKPAAVVARLPLPPPSPRTADMLRLHTYFVLFPLALVAKAVPVDVVLEGAFAASFLAVPALALLMLRRRGVTWLAAAAFAALVVAHGAWAQSLLQGQFYPDRLFVLFGFVLMAVLSRRDAPRWWLVCAALACASVTERGVLIGGLVILAYTALFWSRTPDRAFKIALGTCLLGGSLLLMAFVTTDVPYTTFLPQGAHGVASTVGNAAYGAKLLFFLEMNAPLLVLAAFEPRAAAIAAIVMLPNVFGKTHDARLNGWTTHYHSYYLPILIWAGMEGYARLNALARGRRVLRLAPAAACAALALAASCIDPTQTFANVAPANVAMNFFARLGTDVAALRSPAAPDFRAVAAEVRRAVPPGSSVSSPEATMPELYAGRDVYFFPFGIERADYAVMGMSRGPDGRPVYDGVMSLLPPDSARAVNAVVVDRMRDDGYDFEHAVAVPGLGAVIVHRTPRAASSMRAQRWSSSSRPH
jgi:hypothetical protein